MSDLRESGQFEADAHGILLLWATPRSRGPPSWSSPRTGAGWTGTVDLRFDPQTTTFSAIRTEHRYF